MQKVWYRTSSRSWYATFTENGCQRQLKLLTGPNDRAHKRLAEQKLLDELKSRPACLQASPHTSSSAKRG